MIKTYITHPTAFPLDEEPWVITDNLCKYLESIIPTLGEEYTSFAAYNSSRKMMVSTNRPT